MPTSGTYGFSVSRDDLIAAALRLTQRFGAGDAIPAEDITNCAQALNILAKELATNGLPLWCVVDLAIPMVAGQSVYNLSTASGTTLPLKVLDMYIRNAAGSDTQLMQVSRYDYDLLGQKLASGVPNQAWYNPQLNGGLLTLYNVPVDASMTLHVIIQRQIQDFNLAVDTPDFPQEAYRLLKWCLADEIALEYQATPDVRAEIGAKAAGYRNNYADFGQEAGSIQFTPSQRAQ